jgi:peptidoglycan/LPS O-acetylase OafA/YrhL
MRYGCNVMVSFGGGVWPALGAVAMALLLATASWVLVEKPFLRRKRAV